MEHTGQRERGSTDMGSHIAEAQHWVHRVPSPLAEPVAGLSLPRTQGLLDAVSRMCPNSQGGHGVLAES